MTRAVPPRTSRFHRQSRCLRPASVSPAVATSVSPPSLPNSTGDPAAVRRRRIGTQATKARVSAGGEVDRVVSFVAEKQVVARRGAECRGLIVPEAADKRVVSGGRIDRVVAAVAEDEVGTAVPVKIVSAPSLGIRCRRQRSGPPVDWTSTGIGPDAAEQLHGAVCRPVRRCCHFPCRRSTGAGVAGLHRRCRCPVAGDGGGPVPCAMLSSPARPTMVPGPYGCSG